MSSAVDTQVRTSISEQIQESLATIRSTNYPEDAKAGLEALRASISGLPPHLQTDASKALAEAEAYVENISKSKAETTKIDINHYIDSEAKKAQEQAAQETKETADILDFPIPADYKEAEYKIATAVLGSKEAEQYVERKDRVITPIHSAIIQDADDLAKPGGAKEITKADIDAFTDREKNQALIEQSSKVKEATKQKLELLKSKIDDISYSIEHEEDFDKQKALKNTLTATQSDLSQLEKVHTQATNTLQVTKTVVHKEDTKEEVIEFEADTLNKTKTSEGLGSTILRTFFAIDKFDVSKLKKTQTNDKSMAQNAGKVLDEVELALDGLRKLFDEPAAPISLNADTKKQIADAVQTMVDAGAKGFKPDTAEAEIGSFVADLAKEDIYQTTPKTSTSVLCK